MRVFERDDPHHPGEPDEAVDVPLVALERTEQAAVLLDFWAAVRAGRPAPTTAADNLRTVEMVFAAVEAAAADGGVALDGMLPAGR